jgi:hypothetical protein
VTVRHLIVAATRRAQIRAVRLPILPSSNLGFVVALVAVIGTQKLLCVVSEHLWIFHALLRHFDYALGKHFPRRAGISGPGEPAPGFFNPAPRVVESKYKHSNRLGIEDRFLLSGIRDFDHRPLGHTR